MLGFCFARRLGAAGMGLLVLLAVAGAALTTAQRAEAALCSASAVAITPMHSPDGTPRPFYGDFGRSSANHSGYVGYELSGASLGTDVWIKLAGFTGGKLALAANQSASIPVRATSQAGKALVYAYLTASGTSTTAQTFTVEVWNGKPGITGSTQVCTAADGFVAVEDVINAAANKITSIAVSNSAPAIGGTFNVTAVGDTGTMGAGLASDQSGGNGVFSMAPAMDDAWPADAFTLTGVRTTFGSTTYRDRLRVYPGTGAAGAYTARYDFTVRTTTSGATAVLPVQSIASGTQVKYTGTYPGTLSQISAPTVTASLVKTATSVTGPPYKIAYQVVVSNSASSAVTLDYLRDSPTPTGSSNWTFDAGSARLGGTAIADPALDGGTLVFGGPFSVPGGGSLVFTYSLNVSTTIANSVVGIVGGIEIGASSGTGNQVSVNPTAPIVTTATLPSGTVGTAYSQTLAASSGTSPYSWSITSGSLPAGLSLAGATGVISGTPTGAGTATFTATVTDAAAATGAKSLTLTVGAVSDTTAPAGSLSLNAGAAATASAALTLGLSATDATGVTAYRAAEGSDCSGAAWVAVTSVTSYSATAALTVSSGDGTKTVCVQYRDAAGNTSATATQTISLDTTGPSLSLASATNATVTGAFGVTATFSESVTGFAVGDVVVGNGAVSAFSGSGSSYSFTVTPTADGTVTVDVAAASAADGVGNASTAATRLSRVRDATAPTLTLASAAAAAVAGAFAVTATFSESVTGFIVSDVVVGNGTVSGFAGSGSSYSFTVTPTADGSVTVDVGAGAAADAAGNANAAATRLARTADLGGPATTVSTTGSSPAAGAIPVSVVFAEAVTGFDAADLTVVNGSVSGFSGSGASYGFTVTPGAPGTVEVSVAGGVAVDGAGNANLASGLLAVVYDPVAAPTVTFSALPDDPSEENVAFAWSSTGTVTFTCSLDGTAPVGCVSGHTLVNLADGAHTFTVVAHAAGSLAGSATARWTSRRRIPKPQVLIIPKINATDMLGRPKGFKQSTDSARSAGPFTRRVEVELHIPTPSGADIQVDGVFISNYPDFREARRYPVAADELYDWKLLAGPSGDRPVYIRFADEADAPVGRATIVLDQELPRLKPVFLRVGPKGPGRRKAVAAARPTYCGAAPRRWLRIRAGDGFSGLNAVQIATNVNHPCGWRPYLPTISYRAPGKIVYLRIEDRVGNVSRWYRIVTK